MRINVSATSALVAIIGTAAARPAPAGHVLHEARNEKFAASPLMKRGVAKHEASVLVQIGLAQSNLDVGSTMLMDMSDPHSSNFGNHLTPQEIGALFAPSQASIDAVTAWIRSALGDRAIKLSPSRQWLQTNLTVAELQNLLHTDFHEYEHRTSGKKFLGCEEYHVPSHISQHLDFITPGVKTVELRNGEDLAERLKKRSLNSNKPKFTPLLGFNPATETNVPCSYLVTPDCVRQLYNITDDLTGNKANPLGIYESESEYWWQQDLDDFYQAFASNIPKGTSPKFEAIDGAPHYNNISYAGVEADLDVQAALPLIYPNTVINYQVDDHYYETYTDLPGIFNTFLDALDKSYCAYEAFGITGDSPGIDPSYPDTQAGGYDHPEQCGAYAPTNVISISYSLSEDLPPLNYQLRQCNEWMKLGLQGVSVVVASGDTGVAPQNYQCAQNGTVFNADTPVDCPYITVLGATTLPAGGVPGQTPETASDYFPSSGGFSNIFGQPAFQSAAVNAYFKNHAPPYDYYNVTNNATHTHGRYNRGGRGYPDVSATGQDFAIYYQGQPGVVYGKKPVGFLNPTLYAHPEMFNDIVKGSNPGCSTKGFEAVPGWDPVTGLGTPNYGQMKDVLMSLP